MSPNADLGLAGRLARYFQHAEIVPLVCLLGLMLGIVALAVTPKEEDPQIEVTFANIYIPFPGASAKEVEQLVATPAEQEFAKIRGVKHVYSVSRPGMAVLSVRFQVGVAREPALSRLYNAVFSTEDWLPPNLGVGRPLVKPKGIDDVPVVTVTLWSDNPDKGAYELSRVASALEAELKSLPGTRNVYSTGRSERIVRVTLDPEHMATHRLALDDLPDSFDIPTLFRINNYSRSLGDMVVDNHVTPAQGGTFFISVEDVEMLVVAVENGEPVRLRDIARVALQPATPETYVWYGTGPGTDSAEGRGNPYLPAVTLSVAKKAGENAVEIADGVIQRLHDLKGFLIPEDVRYTFTRDYGKTAWDKASRLLMELLSATFFVMLLVFATMSWREGMTVGLAVIITLAFTLVANWAWGFSLNRVSLFALIFSIGILVDDAIVVVENIHRNIKLRPDAPLAEIIPRAVQEIGNPTIVATFAIVVALMPMAFISGLMGPYMEPIPINASSGMIISLLIAFTVTPWFALRLLKRQRQKASASAEEQGSPFMLALFRRLYAPFLSARWGGASRLALLLAIGLLIVGSLYLPYDRKVVLKMLPFDNKSEFQIVVDMPEGTTLEQTSAVLSDVADHLRTVSEVRHFTAYAGTHSPVNFNGLVRQYYQRQGPNVGDIQISLVEKDRRSRQSHEIALAVRRDLREIAQRHGAVLKVVEMPPGPPVIAPLLAEVYGPDHQAQLRVAQAILELFKRTEGIVDADSCTEAPNQKRVFHVDRALAAKMGTAQMAVVKLLETAVGQRDVSYLHLDDAKYPVPVRLELEDGFKADLDRLLSLRVRSLDNQMVPLSNFTRIEYQPIENAIYHKDLKPYVYVMGDMAGELDSPLYGMWELYQALDEMTFENGHRLEQYLINPPADQFGFGVKWDGEWQVTYETFRDMGIAYSVGIALIYLLVVAHFRSYLVPLIIMAPIPLTLIGVLPGHYLLGAQFTATSMIGMIALAGIIVRNSIILVDFIIQSMAQGVPLREAVIQAGALRAKPIFLTAVSAMLGGFFILADPIFNGLAVSLIFGLLISTLLTLLVIPVAYYSLLQARSKRAGQAGGA